MACHHPHQQLLYLAQILICVLKLLSSSVKVLLPGYEILQNIVLREG